MTEPMPKPFRDSASRNYLLLGLAAVVVVTAVMFVQGGPVAAIIPGAVAALGLTLRWTAMPIFFLVLLAWFLLFPFGVPEVERRFNDVYGSHLRILDIALVGGVLTYFVAQFRLLSLVHQSMPYDRPNRLRKKSDKPTRRPESNVAVGEVVRLFVTAGICVLIGQIAWFLIAEPKIDVRQLPPFDFSEIGNPRRMRNPAISHELTRFLLFTGLSAVFAFGFGLVFNYWRLRRLSRDEARLLLVDTEWSESRRELNRQEKWRVWALPKLKLPSAPEPANDKKGVGCGKAFLIVVGVIFVCFLCWCVVLSIFIR